MNDSKDFNDVRDSHQSSVASSSRCANEVDLDAIRPGDNSSLCRVVHPLSEPPLTKLIETLDNLGAEATPGPWEAVGSHVVAARTRSRRGFDMKVEGSNRADNQRNAAYIAAANPRNVRRLVAAYLALQQEYAGSLGALDALAASLRYAQVRQGRPGGAEASDVLCLQPEGTVQVATNDAAPHQATAYSADATNRADGVALPRESGRRSSDNPTD